MVGMVTGVVNMTIESRLMHRVSDYNMWAEGDIAGNCFDVCKEWVPCLQCKHYSGKEKDCLVRLSWIEP